MNIKPLADRVLINPTPAEEVTMARRNPSKAPSSQPATAQRMKK